MATRYFVPVNAGGGGTTVWHVTSGTTNWSTTSNGAGGSAEPTAADIVFIDAHSGPTVVINAAAACLGIDCVNGTGGAFAGTLTHNTGITLTIGAAQAGNNPAILFNSTMTYTPASTTALVTFGYTSGTGTLTSATQKFAAITQNGVGGTVQQKDDLSINAVQSSLLTITNGIWDAYDGGPGHALTVHRMSSSNSNARSLILGSAVTLGGNVTTTNVLWDFSTTTGLTFTKNSANITVLASSNSGTYLTFSAGAQTYNGLTFNATTTPSTVYFSQAGTFAPLTLNSGWFLLQSSGTTLTTTAFTWTGTAVNPIGMASNGTGIATISCSSGSCSATWISISNITASGSATFTATNALNAGNNANWAFTPPAASTFTAAALATAVWKDTFAGGDFATAGSVGLLMNNMQNLSYTVPAIGRGTVDAGASTTSIPTSAFTPATSASIANQLKGRVVLFDSGTTTVALRAQAAVISASSASATPTLTVGALTATPAVGDQFSII